MSTLSDVQELYGTLHSTWDKSQAHIVAHVALIGVVFGLCGVSLPHFELPNIDPKQIMTSDWFALVKETGVIYVSFAIPFVLVSIYVAILRFCGRACVTLTRLVSGPYIDFSRFRSYELIPMAILLNKEEFEPSDLLIKPQEILLRFQKTFGNDNIPTAIQRPYRNSLIYLGNFLVFLLSWILLFHLSARSEWAMANTSHFWSVALLLLVLVSAAWFRVAHRLTALFRLQVVIASNLALTDPDMGQLLQIPNDRRDQIVKRIEKLLQDARDSAACRQSVNLSVVSFGGVELRR